MYTIPFDCQHFSHFTLASRLQSTIVQVPPSTRAPRLGDELAGARPCFTCQGMNWYSCPRGRGTFMLIHTRMQYGPALDLLRTVLSTKHPSFQETPQSWANWKVWSPQLTWAMKERSKSSSTPDFCEIGIEQTTGFGGQVTGNQMRLSRNLFFSHSPNCNLSQAQSPGVILFGVFPCTFDVLNHHVKDIFYYLHFISRENLDRQIKDFLRHLGYLEIRCPGMQSSHVVFHSLVEEAHTCGSASHCAYTHRCIIDQNDEYPGDSFFEKRVILARNLCPLKRHKPQLTQWNLLLPAQAFTGIYCTKTFWGINWMTYLQDKHKVLQISQCSFFCVKNFRYSKINILNFYGNRQYWTILFLLLLS